MGLDSWREVTSVNLDGVFLTVRHCALAMAASGGGSIVTIASISGMAGSPLFGHYAAAKAGVINLSKTAAIEFRAHGVRVNAVLPSFIDTEMVRAAKPGFDAAIGADFADVIASRQGRLGEVGDVTPLVVFLASDRSRFSTASAFVVDGGWTGSLL
jgi:NAD(P)-dependent dehydrogenase (short-subunit alcohol dehydrogenase family)